MQVEFDSGGGLGSGRLEREVEKGEGLGGEFREVGVWGLGEVKDREVRRRKRGRSREWSIFVLS